MKRVVLKVISEVVIDIEEDANLSNVVNSMTTDIFHDHWDVAGMHYSTVKEYQVLSEEKLLENE